MKKKIEKNNVATVFNVFSAKREKMYPVSAPKYISNAKLSLKDNGIILQ